MSTTEIEPGIGPGVPDTDTHELLRDMLEGAEVRYCCRARGPCACPVPAGADCPECGEELCPICVDLRDKGRAPYA